MIVAIPKEILPGETRVAIVPSTIAVLKKAGLDIIIEKGAGKNSYHPDKEYVDAGATLAKDTQTLFSEADLILKVRPLAQNKKLKKHEMELIGEGKVLISMMDPYFYLEDIQKLAERKITSFAMEFMPRVTRAQSMDVLSSMASISGYRSVIMAAAELHKYFPMLMTAAGTILPAKVFVIGAGVAGLMAIATAKRLGAVVEAYDTRPVVKEQVESVGAKFVELDLETQDAEAEGGYAKSQSEEFYQKQQEQMTKHIRAADIVITTAAIPGKTAPLLVTDAMISEMEPGSVIVDLATEHGGNVEGSARDKKVSKHGVTIVGYIDHPARVAVHASQLYAKNISTFLLSMIKEGALEINQEDELVSGTLVTHQGKIVHPGINSAIKTPVQGE
ncbi:MAG: Re/Si-specific NAD(P)(+) transhydrogenase subunit alpha [SAR324 cluster bacterium]|nr:Re/Si-specific NAD(P)(+) transhydrogenase subunit alpha [SAR324 cluster bacterium]